jgi:uncharacterized surface protein with fasciclin (FAS1) repeats
MGGIPQFCKSLFNLMMGVAFLQSAVSIAAENSQVHSISNPPKKNEVKNHIFEDPDLKTFAKAVTAADLTELFNGTGPFTAFAPTNQAFEKLGRHKLKELLDPKNKDLLASILIYHIVPGKYMAKNLKPRNFKTVNGKEIEITVDNGEIRVNGARVIKADLVGPNGVLHEIDTVLIPSN